MRILFYFPIVPERVESLSYDALMMNHGFSGTETALLEISRYLVQRGHEVIIYGSCNHSYQNHGVYYIPFNQLEQLHNYDIFCPLFYVATYECQVILDKLPKNTMVWLWLHCFIEERYIHAIKEKGFNICASFPSSFIYNYYDISSKTVIGNAINQIFIDTPKAPPLQRKGNWCFHATYERGGYMAQKVFKYVQHQNPSACKCLMYGSYYTPDLMKHSSTNDIKYLGSLSKIKLAETLAITDYFVYPLALPNGIIHHDTFASVILEALVSGAIVITWGVACIPEVYGDYVVSVQPDIIYGYDPNARFSNNQWMLSDEAVERLGNKILYLEEHPEEKEHIRQRGMQWAKQFTWEYRGEQYESWLKSVIS